MAENVKSPVQQDGSEGIEPAVLSDVATRAHPVGTVDTALGDNASEASATQLEDVLPEINQLARKVGGFKKLAEIAGTLGEMGK